MVAQLGQRPSRLNTPQNSEFEKPSRLERAVASTGGNKNPVNQINNAKNVAKNVFKKPITLNFICMLLVVGVLDFIGVFTNVIPGAGIILTFIYNIIFIPWFYFSGIKFNAKKIGSMGVTSILEYIPIIGNLPLMTLNVIYSYYSE